MGSHFNVLFTKYYKVKIQLIFNYIGLRLGVNFIDILRAHFSYKILAPKITKLKCD